MICNLFFSLLFPVQNIYCKSSGLISSGPAVVTLTPWSPANAEETSRQGFTKAVSRGSAFGAYLSYDNKDFHPIEIGESL